MKPMMTLDEWKSKLYSKGPNSDTEAQLQSKYQTYCRQWEKANG